MALRNSILQISYASLLFLFAGVLLDGQVARDDDGRHQGAGGEDQAGAGRGESECE